MRADIGGDLGRINAETADQLLQQELAALVKDEIVHIAYGQAVLCKC